MPIVVICGQVPRAAIGTDAFQEAPVFNIMGAVAKHVFLVTDETKLEATIRTAFEIARTGRPGPGGGRHPEGRAELAGRLPGRGPARRCAATTSACAPSAAAPCATSSCEAFFELLGEAERPLIYAGGGVINGEASEELREFAGDFGHPGGDDADGHRRLRHHEPLSLRMLGMHGTAFANYAVEDCDFLIAIGARFDDRVAGSAGVRPQREASRTSTSTPPRSARSSACTGATSACCRRRCAALVRARAAHGLRARLSAWHRHVAGLKTRHAMDYDRDSELIQPDYVHRGDQPPHARRGDHHHRRRPAPDVGRAVLRLPRAAAVAHLGQHGHHGLRPAGGDRRAARQPATASSSTSTATAASA